MNYLDAIQKATITLKKNNIKSYKIDSEILLCNTLKIKREKLLLNLDHKIQKKIYNKFINLVLRRKKGEPIAYIIGYKEFWKNKYIVNSNDFLYNNSKDIFF